MSFLQGRMTRWRSFIADDESGQDAFEYMLATATLVVVLFLGLLVYQELVPDVAGTSCESVDTAADPVATDGSCIDEAP